MAALDVRSAVTGLHIVVLVLLSTQSSYLLFGLLQLQFCSTVCAASAAAARVGEPAAASCRVVACWPACTAGGLAQLIVPQLTSVHAGQLPHPARVTACPGWRGTVTDCC
jgi:hypothetical protein